MPEIPCSNALKRYAQLIKAEAQNEIMNAAIEEREERGLGPDAVFDTDRMVWILPTPPTEAPTGV